MAFLGFGKKNASKTEAKHVEHTSSQPKEEKAGFFGKVKKGLSKSSNKLGEGLKDVFVRQKLDDEALEELEDILIMSDMGIEASAEICGRIAKDKLDKQITDQEVKEILASYCQEVLEPLAKPLTVNQAHKPHIILACGVNGTGKTTTLGKLAHQYKQQGHKVMLAACDTFRAAAVDQLDVWAKRADVPVITGAHEADPASVAHQAIEQAIQQQTDVLLIDTAGRLQNKHNLMEQLAKIVRVIQKQIPDAPHDTIIVLDATTGQNATQQVQTFNQMVNLTGIILTKLDGTAKGGILVSLAKSFALPIHAIGVGESIDDLQSFDAKNVAQSMVGIT